VKSTIRSRRSGLRYYQPHRSPLDQVQIIRLFSVICFVLLVCLLVRQQNHGLLLPFLITPQLWYVFGYANSDCFGVTASTLLLLFLNITRFTFHRFAIGGSFARFLQLIPIFILLALLCFSKPNYWVSAIFCFCEPLVRVQELQNETAAFLSLDRSQISNDW
jgi:uncharacterized membrane protein